MYLQEHAAELFERAAEMIRNSPALSAMAERYEREAMIVQNFQLMHNNGGPDPKAFSLCRYHAQNGEENGDDWIRPSVKRLAEFRCTNAGCSRNTIYPKQEPMVRPG